MNFEKIFEKQLYKKKVLTKEDAKQSIDRSFLNKFSVEGNKILYFVEGKVRDIGINTNLESVMYPDELEEFKKRYVYIPDLSYHYIPFFKLRKSDMYPMAKAMGFNLI